MRAHKYKGNDKSNLNFFYGTSSLALYAKVDITGLCEKMGECLEIDRTLWQGSESFRDGLVNIIRNLKVAIFRENEARLAATVEE